MKYIKLFKSINDRINYVKSDSYQEPHVSYTLEDMNVKVNNYMYKYENDKYNLCEYEEESLINYRITPDDSLSEDHIKIELNNDERIVTCSRKAAKFASCEIINNTIYISKDDEYDHEFTFDIYGKCFDTFIDIQTNNSININLNSVNINNLYYANDNIPVISVNNYDYDTNINIDGINTISSNNDTYSILCSGNVYINGSGTLEISNDKYAIHSKNIYQSSATIDINLYESDNSIGIYVSHDLILYDGNLYINATDENGIGIISNNDILINNGNVSITTNNICMSSTHNLYINNGDITLLSKNDLCMDISNNIYMEGGNIMIFGSSNKSTILCNHLECNGVTLLYTSEDASVLPYTKESQTYLIGTSISYNQEVSLYTIETTNEESKFVCKFKIPSNYSNNNRLIIMSHPDLKQSTYYYMNIGSKKYKVYSAQIRSWDTDWD